MEKKILDATCGARTMRFDKNHPAAVFCDKREESYQVAFGKNRTNVRHIGIKPDVVCDFTALPFNDKTFSLVVFDPPHLTTAKETAWLVKNTGNWMRTGHRCLEKDFLNA